MALIQAIKNLKILTGSWNINFFVRAYRVQATSLDRLAWRSRLMLRLVNQVRSGHWLTGASAGHRLFLLKILF